jgi:hypothetical protein
VALIAERMRRSGEATVLSYKQRIESKQRIERPIADG